MSLALSSEAPPGVAAPRLSLNKRELARVLNVSLPTITAWLDRYSDFPVFQAGTNGREYQFDPFAVRAFLDEREAEERRLADEREAQIAQLGLPLEEQTDGADALKPRDRLDHIRAIQAEDKLRVERGFLVSVPAQRQAMTSALARWNRALHAAMRQCGRDFNLPDAVVRALTDSLGETQRQFVRELRADAGLPGYEKTT